MQRLLLTLSLLLALSVFAAARLRLESVAWNGVVELPGGTTLKFLVELEGDSGTISIPAQNALDLPLSDVRVSDKELHFAISSAHAVWDLQVAEDGQSAVGVLKQGGEFKTTMKRLAADEKRVKALVRPQDPRPPFPYTNSEVLFENKAAGIALDGTLSVPHGDGPFACAVLVTGSGPQDRDESLMGHRPFAVIADHLARHGIAVLRYDDRGVGKSKGKFTGATTDDFAGDALAAVEFAKSRTELDPTKLGIIGHSEGGLIAPMCAAQSKDVAFIVLLAGTGLSGAELMPIQGELIALASGTALADAEEQARDSESIFALIVAGKGDEEVRAAIRAIAIRQLKSADETKDMSDEDLDKRADAAARESAAQLLAPWFKRFLMLDPRVNLRQVKCPVLAINGEKDFQVPPKQNLSSIEKALAEAGNEDVTVRELPGLNHLFQTCTTGSPLEYGDIEETFAPAALELVSAWIRKRVGLE